MKRVLVLIISIILVIFFIGYKMYTTRNMRVTAVFEKLEPFPKNIDVYYKGFKLGRTVKVYPSKDFKTTSVDMILNVKGIDLPENISAKVRVKNKRDYVEIEYPDEPSVSLLKNHSVIKGETCQNISSYIDAQAENGSLDELRDNLNTTIQTAAVTLNSLTELLDTTNGVVKDLKPSLIESGNNLAIASKNLADVTGDLSKSANTNMISNTFENIEQTTVNIERMTKNLENSSIDINDITENANKNTMLLINCLIKNINDIVVGFKNTLSTRFGGMKVMFGKPMS